MRLKIAILSIFLALSSLASVLDNNFLKIEKDKITLLDQAKFYSYIKALDEPQIIQNYKEIFKSVQFQEEQSDTAVTSYEKVFGQLRDIYAKLYFEHSSANIDTYIKESQKKQSVIVAQLLDMRDSQPFDTDVLPQLLRYFELDRRVLGLQAQKLALEEKRLALIDAAIHKKLLFDDYDVSGELPLRQEKQRYEQLSKKDFGIETALSEYRLLCLQINSDFVQKIHLLKSLKTAPNPKEKEEFELLLNKKYEPSTQTLKAASIRMTAGQKQELLSLVERFSLLKAVNRQDNKVFTLIFQGVDSSVGAKSSNALNSFARSIAEWLDSPLIVTRGFNLRPKNILFVLLGIFLVLLIKKLVLTRVLKYALKRKAQGEHLSFVLEKIASFTAYTAIFLLLLSGLDMDLTSLAIVVSAFSVGIGFGLQGVVSNFVSGLILLFENSVKIGDILALQDGRVGVVSAVNLRTTTIKTLDDTTIIIPNATMFIGQIENLTKDNHTICRHVKFTVAYGTDLKTLSDALHERSIALGAVKLPAEPLLTVVNLGNYGLECDFKVFVDMKEKPLANSDFYEAFLEEFERLNVQLPYPKMEILKPISSNY